MFKLKLIMLAFASLVLLAPSMAVAGNSHDATEVGCITPSEYEKAEELGGNLTDAVAFEPLFADQVKPFDVALMAKRWGRMTRRHKDWN